MGTDKRERKKANRAAKLEAEQAEARRAKRNQTIRSAVIGAIAVMAVLALITVLSGCGSDDADDGAASEPTETSSEATETACESAPDGVRVIDFDEPPTAGIAPGDEVTATFETSEGTVVVELDTERTPKTADNFAALAQHCYYDGTDLFRTEASTGIIQGGAPLTQDNSDPGPGYTIEDEGLPFTSDDYGPGTIAMANTGMPDSAGAQFFFLAGEGGRYLGDESLVGPSAGSYAVFGTVREGLEVLEVIAALDDGTGAPSRPVTIEQVTITGA
jgi:peptidyl-prolyl cis-trans isomerase B (cyclophilin B)